MVETEEAMKPILAVLLFALSCRAVILSWEPSQSPDLAGYIVHYGTNSGTYLVVTNVGNVTNFTIPNSNLFLGRNFFMVGSVNSNGVEFDMSAEVGYTIWKANLRTKTTLALESSGNPFGPWQKVASLAYSDAALTNRFYRGKIYPQ